MKNKYLLWLGLFVWFGLSTILYFVGINIEIVKTIPIIGAMILCVYGIRR